MSGRVLCRDGKGAVSQPRRDLRISRCDARHQHPLRRHIPNLVLRALRFVLAPAAASGQHAAVLACCPLLTRGHQKRGDSSHDARSRGRLAQRQGRESQGLAHSGDCQQQDYDAHQHQSLMNDGTDTSALTVEWGMAELMANPGIMKQSQEEIDAVVGQDRLVQESDLPNLPFLRAVVKETFRMHQSAPMVLFRKSHQPCVVAGCNLPAETELILNIFAIHRDPSVYESPDEFKPSRFVERPEVDPLSGHDHFELIPFSAGRRMCPGANLANVMVISILANLLQCFDWALPGGGSVEALDMAECYVFMSRRRQPLRLVAHPRRAASLFRELP